MFSRPCASLASMSHVLLLSPRPWVFIHKLSLDNSLYLLNVSYMAHIVQTPLHVFTHTDLFNPYDNPMNQVVLLALLKRSGNLATKEKIYWTSSKCLMFVCQRTLASRCLGGSNGLNVWLLISDQIVASGHECSDSLWLMCMTLKKQPQTLTSPTLDLSFELRLIYPAYIQMPTQHFHLMVNKYFILNLSQTSSISTQTSLASLTPFLCERIVQKSTLHPPNPSSLALFSVECWPCPSSQYLVWLFR